MTFQQSQLQTIDAANLKQLIDLDRQQIMLVDVREPGEYASERIAGAIAHPLSTFNPASIEHRSDRQMILCCQSGRRSTQAAHKLFEAGFTDVTHLEGGLAAWKAAGYATQIDLNAPISLFRQIQIVAGSLVAIGTICGVVISPWFLLLSGFVGCGLVFAGISDTCAMGVLLAKLPYNQRTNAS
jgi:rhodanese-related sulfurtransferase